ncbi:MAG: glucokinase [Sphingomonadaceae bacterium]
MTAQSLTTPLSPTTGFAGGPRLLADIGGTNARFALELGPGQIAAIEVLACAEYPTLAAALVAYLASPAVASTGAGTIRNGAIAIANPVIGDLVRMTNHHWEFSIEALRREAGFDMLAVVNDFTALARSLPLLSAEQKRQVGGGVAVPATPLGLIGAGTGLGVSGLIPGQDGWTALLSEGGHVSFSPVNETEVAILRFAWKEFDHVSAERLLSGVGIELIYRALAEHGDLPGEALPAAEISRRALAGECSLCDDVIEAFCCMLGTIAANVAITLGAQGGIYIGGGIVPRLGARFDRSGFRARFEHKGRFAAYLAQIPTYVITAQYPAFVGVSAILSEKIALA